MFKAISRLFGSKPKAPRLSTPQSHGIAATPKYAPVPAAPSSAPSAREIWEAEAAQGLSPHASPEELAGITPDMTLKQARERLAMLYQRHNRATTSLDPKLREEAEIMLETLAGLREKYVE